MARRRTLDDLLNKARTDLNGQMEKTRGDIKELKRVNSQVNSQVKSHPNSREFTREFTWELTREDETLPETLPGQLPTQTPTQIPRSLHGNLPGNLLENLNGNLVETLPETLSGLSRSKILLLCFLYHNDQVRDQVRNIGNRIGVSYGTMKRIIGELEEAGFLHARAERKGVFRGTRFILVKEKIKPLYETLCGNLDETLGETLDGNLGETLVEPTDGTKVALKEEIRKRYLSLVRVGIQEQDIGQVIEHRRKTGVPLDDLEESLRVADTLAGDPEYLAGKYTGKEISQPLAYFLECLKRGPVTLPKGYVTPYERKRRQQKEDIKRLDEEEFQVWKEGLGREELDRICEGGMGPREPWLKKYWRENVKSPSKGA